MNTTRWVDPGTSRLLPTVPEETCECDEHVIGVANDGPSEESGIGGEQGSVTNRHDSATIPVPPCDLVSFPAPHVLRPSRHLATLARGPHFVAVPMMCGDTGGTPMLKRSIVIEEKPACCRCAPVRRSGRQPSATAFQKGRMPC